VPAGVLVASASAPDSAPDLASALPTVAATETSGIAISTNPVVSLQPMATLFGQSPNPLFQVQNASLLVGGR